MWGRNNHMAINKDANTVYKEYEKGREYKTAIKLYDTVKMNENFYLGKQWEGVNAPDIEKPVVNILRQGVDYCVSMIVSDDIGVQCHLPEDLSEETRQAIENVIADEIDKVFEQTKFKAKCRKFIKGVAVDGDNAFHWWYNTEKNLNAPVIGEIDLELIDNTNIIFGNPAQQEVQKQPYILLIARLPLNEVKEMAQQAGVDPELITADTTDYNQRETDSSSVETYTTLITKLWKDKQKNTIMALKCTKNAIIKEEVDLCIPLYPFAWQSWRENKTSYHGEGLITSQIQNQIVINKYYMMLNEWLKKMAFPKLLYDMTKISTWSNKVEAIGVNGNPNEAIASSSPVIQMSAQVIQYIQDLIDKTKETMGIYDVALGNARPENTSAIIALQKTASQPLELQRMDYYQVVEDCVRIILALMAANYGEREIPMKVPMNEEDAMVVQQLGGSQLPGQPPVVQGAATGMVDITVPFNFADFGPDNVNLIIDVGAASYWSELMQIQSADNMYQAGIIPDAITYLEQIPNGIVKNKKAIIEAIKQKKAEDALMMQQQQEMAMMNPKVGTAQNYTDQLSQAAKLQ
jgi:hypothetical protein